VSARQSSTQRGLESFLGHHDGQAIFSLATHFFVPAIFPRLPSLI
jgi:hypothetical protein